jgi:hypothetical protein
MLVMTLISGLSAQELAPLPDKDPFLGTWRTNPDKCRPKLEREDASYVRTYARDGDDRIFSSRTGTRKIKENHYRFRCDGLPHPITYGNMLSCRYRSGKYRSGVLVEGELVDVNIKRTSYWTQEVSADGRELIVLGYTDEKRTKLTSVVVLDRVK